MFRVYFIGFSTIFFRCDDFAWFYKAMGNYINLGLANSYHNLFLVKLRLWEMLWSFSSIQPLHWTFTIVVQNPLFITSYNLIEKRIISVAKKKGKRDFKMFAFMIIIQFMRNPFIHFFKLCQSILDDVTPHTKIAL